MNGRENTSVTIDQTFAPIESDVSGTISITAGIITDILKTRDKRAERVHRHIINWLMNPDEGSKFKQKTCIVRFLARHSETFRENWLIPLMVKLGYDGIIALYGEEIIGHAFFQAHKKNTELHLFSIAVSEQLRKRKVSMFIGQSFIEHGRIKPEVTKVRISGGGNPNITVVFDTIRAIFEGISRMSGELGIETDDLFFAYFLDRHPRKLSGIIEPKKEEK